MINCDKKGTSIERIVSDRPVVDLNEFADVAASEQVLRRDVRLQRTVGENAGAVGHD